MFEPKVGTIFEADGTVYIVALVEEGRNGSPIYYCLRYNPQSDGSNFDSAYTFSYKGISDAQIIGNIKHSSKGLKKFIEVMDKYYELDYDLGCLVRSELNENEEQ